MQQTAPQVTANVLDRLICALAPERGHKRLVFKELAARQIATMGKRSYDIARLGRSTEGWRAMGTSASSEIGGALSIARNRSRDLVRNNPYADSAISKLQKKIVGTGINPRVSNIETQKRKRIMAAWDAFSENCDPQGLLDYPGLQSLAARTVAESGEALIVYRPRPSKWKLQIPLQVEVLEPDYLDHTKTVILESGNVVIQGVEFDKDKRRVAYWLFDHHPGDGLLVARGSLQSHRISADYVDHVFDMLRPGQVRGLPWLASAALKMRDLADYEEAELVRKKIESCTVAFVTRAGTASSLTQQGLEQDSQGRSIEQMAPGMIHYGRPGEGIEFNNPSSMQGTGEYIIQQLKAIAAGIGTPYHILTGDVSQANYSSTRAAMLDFWDLLDHWQHLMMVPMMGRKTWSRFESLCVARGIEVPEDRRVLWTPPARAMIDPLKDTEAEKNAQRLGLKTWDESVAARGYDPDDVMAEHTARFKKFDENGLVFDGDPRRVQLSGKAHNDQSTQPKDENNGKV